MKAIIKTEEAPGALALQDWPEPDCGPGQVGVAIEHAGICSTDVAIYDWTYRGRHPVQIPTMLGHEAFGRVDEVGEGVSDVRVGDRVGLQVIWGHAHARPSLRGFENLDPDWFHIGASRLGGAFAERIALPADRILKVPDDVGPEDAALLEPAAVAANAMELVNHRPGDSFVLIGPGPFGLLMTQMARNGGASQIVVVGLHGIDEARLEMARRAGADTVLTFDNDIDATVSAIHEATRGYGGDVVIDSGGTADSTFLALDAAAPAGRVAIFGFTKEAKLEPLRQIIRKGLSLYGVSAAQRRHYGTALRLLESGQIKPSEIISHRLPLSETARGIELVKSREASKVLLSVSSGSNA